MKEIDILRTIYIYIFRNKSFCPISKGIRNFDIYRARNISRSMISGRKKKFVFQRKGFSLICPACLKKGKRKGGGKKKLPAQISREKAFLRCPIGARQREAASHHDRVKIRQEGKRKAWLREGEREGKRDR